MAALGFCEITFCPALFACIGFATPGFAAGCAATCGGFAGAALEADRATTFFTLTLAGFFAAAALGFSFFSDNSNTGLGNARSCAPSPCGPTRVTSAAGFTPAAAAAFAAASVN